MSIDTKEDQKEGFDHSHSRGKVFVVGTGPGDLEHLTPAARKAIENSTAVVGYRRYVNLIKPILKDQKLSITGMMQEVHRCQDALNLAEEGEIVSIISSGDPGVYGMAGLILDLNKNPEIEIEIVPGVSAVTSAASLLGAPLMHDFVVISLSDLLTPWQLIEKRLRCAAEGDFVIVIYNPKSKKRVEQIEKTREIISQFQKPETPVAIVTSAYREGESIVFSDLNSFTNEEIGMQSTVFIGSSQTKKIGNRLITPRGYEKKYADSFL